jgi:flotillin
LPKFSPIFFSLDTSSFAVHSFGDSFGIQCFAICPSESDEAMFKALEAFLGKSESAIRDSILQTLEGHLRSILGTLTVEEVYQDRENFARLVREHASPDVAKMGLEILSFTIKDVADSVGYLDSLGKKQIAAVVAGAEIGKAESARDSGIAVRLCSSPRIAM